MKVFGIDGLRYRFDWWLIDRADARKDDVQSGKRKVRFAKLRWRLAERIDGPGRCWSSLAEFALGWTNRPGVGKNVAPCRASALACGSCYCGKFVSRALADEHPLDLAKRIVVDGPSA